MCTSSFGCHVLRLIIYSPDVTILLVGSQFTSIISFFVSRNIRIARQRVWDQTVASRGKGPDFWQPYVEEWDCPPVVNEYWGRLNSIFTMWFWRVIIQKGDRLFHNIHRA